MIMAQAFVILFATATAPARAADPVAIACKEASGRLSASCGPYGNLTCPTNKKKGGVCGLGLSHCRANECCSQYGICGTGKGDCNAVCQCELSGKSSGCNGRLIPDPVLPVVDLASVCGTHIGRCPDNYCCSGYGFCTNNETICNGNGECSQPASGKGSACKSHAPSQLFKYDFTLTWGKMTIAGVKRPVILTNGQYPAPLINVSVGDRVVITVHNELQSNYPVTISGKYYPLTEADNNGTLYPQQTTCGNEVDNEVTIHWHGLVQRNSVIMDGVAEVTQQAIGVGKSQVYSFIADSVGPFWYHSHFKAQYLDGLRGPILVNSRIKKQPVNQPAPIMVSDWYFDPANPLLKWFMSPTSAGDEPIPDAVIMGQYGQAGSCRGTGCKYEVINAVSSPIECTPERATNKLRFINGAGFARMYLTIDDHVMSIVALDAVDIIPSAPTPIFIFSPGQRISVLVCPATVLAKAKADAGGSFWIRPTIFPNAFPQPQFNRMEGNEHRFTGLGVLNYGAPQASGKLKKVPTSLPWAQGTAQYIEIQNMLNNFTDDSYISQPISGATPPPADINITMDIILSPVDDMPNARPEIKKEFTGVVMSQFDVHGSGDGPITFFRRPHYPSLLQKRLNGDLPPNENFGPNVINVTAGQVIQLIINNKDGGNHPLHLHGHWFWVMQRSSAGGDPGDEPPGVPNYFDPKTAHFDQTPVLRDTTEIRPFGNTVLRFVADNPGMWILHCHIDWHLVGGLSVVFNYHEAPGYGKL